MDDIQKIASVLTDQLRHEFGIGFASDEETAIFRIAEAIAREVKPAAG